MTPCACNHYRLPAYKHIHCHGDSEEAASPSWSHWGEGARRQPALYCSWALARSEEPKASRSSPPLDPEAQWPPKCCPFQPPSPAWAPAPTCLCLLSLHLLPPLCTQATSKPNTCSCTKHLGQLISQHHAKCRVLFSA